MAPLIMLFNSTATTNCSSSVQTKEAYDATGAALFILLCLYRTATVSCSSAIA
jgi:hypothetical protein